MAMDHQQIIMNYTLPPSVEDLTVIAQEAMDNMPEEILELCDDIAIRVEELADEVLEQELDLEDPFELLALYRSGKQLSPGVESKIANDDDVLIIFRRPVLDLWCEHGENINSLMRQTIIEELGQNFDFSDDEIEEMSARHYQGML